MFPLRKQLYIQKVITISKFYNLFELFSTTRSRNWYVRIEDSKKSVVVFSPFHNRTEVLAKKRMSGLLTPVTIHLRVENAGAPSLLWIGFEGRLSDPRPLVYPLTHNYCTDHAHPGQNLMKPPNILTVAMPYKPECNID